MNANGKNGKFNIISLSKYIWKEYSVVVVFVLIIVIAGIAAPRFLSLDNVLNLLLSTSIVGMIALGMTLKATSPSSEAMSESRSICSATTASWIP
jgi:ABC-type xylose transport system permease subunit